jgi:hypothetical protein
MVQFLKLMPAVALAMALLPAAANARNPRAGVPDTAHPQYLVNAPQAVPVSVFSAGRSAERSTPAAAKVVVTNL